MSNQSLSDKLAVLAVVVALILTVWGDATVMLVAGTLGLAVTAVLMRKNVARQGED